MSVPQPAPVARTFQSDLTAAQQEETVLSMMFPPHTNAVPPAPSGMVITVSANVATPAPRIATVQAITQSAEAVWDAVTGPIDGYVLHFGTNSIQTPVSDSPYCFVPYDPSSTQPTFYTVACFTNYTTPVVICHTNRSGVYCVTNTISEGPRSEAAMDCTTNLIPFGSVQGTNLIYTAYGFSGLHYVVIGSNDLSTWTETGFAIDGANAPWVYTNTPNWKFVTHKWSKIPG